MTLRSTIVRLRDYHRQTELEETGWGASRLWNMPGTAQAEQIFCDKWHPPTEKPYFQRIEIVGY